MMNETGNSQFPTSCPGCQKWLHGPVSFCPYCRYPYLNSEALNPRIPDPAYKSVDTSSPPVPESGKEKKPPTDLNEQDLPKKDKEQIIDVFSTTVLDRKHSQWREWMRVILVVVISIIAVGSGIWLLNNRGSPKEPVTSNKPVFPQRADPQSTGKPPTPRTLEPTQKNPQETDAKREAARVLALGALRYCTDLSVAISKLPKMEKVLKAAQNLEDVSPRYQDQVVQAKKTLGAVREDRDKCLMACMDKMTQLSRYGSDPRIYAVQTVKNSDLFPREKIVWGLLENYEQELSNGKELDPNRWLSDFSGKFSNFVE
jgi:hypothetical protein